MQKNAKETVIICPTCSNAHMAVTIQHDNVTVTDYMILRCMNCHNRLCFVIDLTPSIDRTDVACSLGV